VPSRSMNTTNCIERQAMPQRSDTNTSSIKLCIVELIHRLLCDSKTWKVSGTTVLQTWKVLKLILDCQQLSRQSRNLTACGRNIIWRFGKVLSINVERNRSSPKNKRFLACNVVTTFWLYSKTISGLASKGTQAPFLGALTRYMQKQPGRQVTPPNTDSNALA
jgi:hypothetical protein